MSEKVLEELKQQIQELPRVESHSGEAYYANRNSLQEFVDQRMRQRDDIDELIGHRSLDVMKENHENHALFMSNVFLLNDYRLLVDTVPWVYNTYRQMGFSYEYFPLELEAWKQAVKSILGEDKTASIIEVYDWLKENHDDFVAISRDLKRADLPEEDEEQAEFDKFLEALLLGEDRKAQQIAENNIETKDDFGEFARNVIKPAMYTIGIMWQQNDITTAEEHRATSIAARVLSTFHIKYLPDRYSRGKAAVSAVANELHELGARIVADFLEFDGWDVSFLGADTPREELIEFLRKEEPFLLGLSVCVPYNLKELQEIIAEVRSEPDLQDIKILVGGKALNDFPYLIEKIDADARAEDGRSAVEIANRWWSNRDV